MDQRGGLPLRAGHGGVGRLRRRFTLEHALGIKDRDGVSFGEALQAIGYDGKEPVGGRPVGAFFEAHIEQGPILERQNKTIGVVTVAQGQPWYEISWTGMESHAGSTPMDGRRDALVGAAELIVEMPQDRQPAQRTLDHRCDPKPAAVAQHHSRPRVHDGGFPPSRQRRAHEDGRRDAGRGRRHRQAPSPRREDRADLVLPTVALCQGAGRIGAPQRGAGRLCSHGHRERRGHDASTSIVWRRPP